MPGRKLTREAGKRLDAYGEDGIFELYMEHRSVRKLLANLPPEVGTMSTAPFYFWLKADEGRWAAWQDVREAIANDLVEESLAIADEAEEQGVPSARLRVEQQSAGSDGCQNRQQKADRDFLISFLKFIF